MSKTWKKRLIIGVVVAVALFLVVDAFYVFTHRSDKTAENTAANAYIGSDPDALPKSTGANATDYASLQTDLKSIDAALSGSATSQSSADTSLDDQSTQGEAGNDRLELIKSRGDAEIARRLAALDAAIVLISRTDNLSAENEQLLNNEAGAEVGNLTLLRYNLRENASTTAEARQIILSMVTEYRVYALVLPKIHLIATADAQRTVEQKLAALQAKLETRLEQSRAAGTDTASLQAKLGEMNSHTVAAQALTDEVETAVLPLQPTDYNNDHTILRGYNAKLKTAGTNNRAAYDLAKEIASALR